MASRLVRLWDKEFDQSFNCVVDDWVDGIFTINPHSAFSEELRRWDVVKPRVITCLSADEVVWVVDCWEWTRERMRVVCKPSNLYTGMRLAPDAAVTGKWRVFKEKVPTGWNPKWVVWEAPNWEEHLFDTGEEAHTYVAEQISKRHWASIISKKIKELP